MAKSQSVIFSLVLLAAIAFVGQAQQIDICAKAKYVPLCRSVVKGATNPKVASKIAMEHLLFETKRAKSKIVMVENEQAIRLCSENYDHAIGRLEYNWKDYLEGKETKAIIEPSLAGAMRAYAGCSDAIGEISTFSVVKLASKVMNTDTMLKHLARNCMHIVSLLK